MNPKHPLDSLQSIEPPEPSADAKREATQRAMAEFRAQAHETADTKATRRSFFQGISSWLRPTHDISTKGRRQTMAFSTKTTVFTGLATACVALVGVGVAFQYYALPQPEHLMDQKAVEQEISRQQKSPAAERPHALQAEEVVVTGMRSEKRLRESAHPSADAAVTMQNHAQPLALTDQYHPPGVQQPGGRDQFERVEENPLKQVRNNPVSTFSADVDTASYSFVRRQLNQGVLPQKDAVRIEEMINYFDYDYPLPASATTPFKPSVVVMDSPWADGKKLLHIGIKGFDVEAETKPRTNLVFLLDVSGSMNGPDRLPLVKQSMALLLNTLHGDDTVAIAVYAGAAGTVLEPTKAKDKNTIMNALNSLQAGGSTAGGAGIKLAYQLAEQNFDKDAINRVILATDGDFNVGISDRDQLQDFVERQRNKGIYLSILGFGQGNYNDHLMQTLAQNGNGIAAYIDTLSEAQKVLVHEASSSLFPIAKDVKIQVEFNPAQVAEYRLIGYETRHLNREDFNNDAVDAGDIGAGHTVTAIYEITPVNSDARLIEDSRYQKPETREANQAGEYAFLKMRYKLPDEDKSRLLELPITPGHDISRADDSLANEAQFATAVAAFGQLLKGSNYVKGYSYDDIIALSQNHKGADDYGYRTEFVQLVRKAKLAQPM